MIALLIGITCGLLAATVAEIQKRMDKPTIFGILLAGIAFLYVGFTWTDVGQLIVNILQAVFFMILSYYGINRSIWFLIVGYFAHAVWDILYQLISDSLIPPHYDLFCLAVDFTISGYLLMVWMAQGRSLSIKNILARNN